MTIPNPHHRAGRITQRRSFRGESLERIKQYVKRGPTQPLEKLVQAFPALPPTGTDYARSAGAASGCDTAHPRGIGHRMSIAARRSPRSCSGTELPMIYARRPSHDIPAVPVEIRVHISPHRLDAFDVGTGETIALHVETQSLHQVTLIPRSYHTCCGCLGSIV